MAEQSSISQQSPAAQAPRPDLSQIPRDYEPDASIVLIGIRGSGKSTLGVMVASALRYQLVDADRHFFQTTGLSRAAFKSSYGAEEYRRQEVEATRSILLNNPSKAIIVCGPGSVEGTGQRLLLDFAKSHPVIYVERESKEIQKHVGVSDEAAFSQLLHLGRPVYRSISTYDFYNISDPSVSEFDAAEPVPGPLSLKKLERDFLQFIYRIKNCPTDPPVLHGTHVKKFRQKDCKDFSYALHLPMSELEAIVPKLQDSDLMVEAINLIVDLPAIVDDRPFDHAKASFISKQFRLVQRNFHLPIIFDIQLPAIAASNREKLRHVYFDVLHFGLRLVPEYLCMNITMDEDMIQNLVSIKGSTKIIGSYFDHSPGLDGWRSQGRKDAFRRARELGCDIIRLCQDANSAEDNISVQQFRAGNEQLNQHQVSLIAYNTGILGRTSCFLNRVFTPVTHPLLRCLNSTASPDWLLTVSEAQNALFASFVLDRMYFGIFGANVATSLSPAMHNAALKLLGMPHEYGMFQRSSVEDVKALVQDPHFGGASITAPYKSQILPLLHSLSSDAQAIGAVNTIIPIHSFQGTNRAGHIDGLKGANTDWKGIITCIRRNLSPINAVKPRTTGLVLGAGGMARAAVFAMIRLGVRNIFVHNRTVRNAEEMVNHFHGQTLFTDSGETVVPQLCASFDAEKSLNSGGPAFGSCLIRVLPSMGTWPAGFQPPTIIVSCVPAHGSDGSITDLSLPHDWFGSMTGGVLVEVRCLREFLQSANGTIARV